MLVTEKIRKAVIPAAGLGTRFLPVTKTMPKEMLPIINVPAIHLVVEEAIKSGIDDIIIITARGKRSIEDYFDESPELEAFLARTNNNHLLKVVRDISSLADIHYIRQKEPRGLGDAVLCAERHIGDEPFAVLLGDDIVVAEKPCLKQLIEIFHQYKKSVIAVEEVPEKKVSSYGIIKGTPIDDRIIKIEEVVEKPSLATAPSRMGAIGRYVFNPELFDCIRKTKPGVGKEIQIADGINGLNQKQGVLAYRFIGTRYDVGNPAGCICASIDFALKDKELSADILPFMQSRIPGTKNEN